ncbi:MarR family transcriptional regulator [Kribbella antibiotica]|uniref:MarR family transcriptional regulator n=1 Tax=Kribbella antibiotica TaxID=190195 RepID=A0A4R4ZRP7_9ACTN|nr:MarR family winged helix-turn-helix transcriptional regulator [Kribbella antibiotica]TDD61663.1 MarR family transcriptional regulator [Kribbella antibiotica]
MTDPHAVLNNLVRLETELWNELDARLRTTHGLPMAMYEPIRLIAGASLVRVHDIAEGLGLTAGGASKLVDRLVEAGYVERSTNPHDRRSSVLEPTDLAREGLRVARRTVSEALESLVTKPLTSAELETLSLLLDRLRTHLRNTQSLVNR